jgi:hypothetical protein
VTNSLNSFYDEAVPESVAAAPLILNVAVLPATLAENISCVKVNPAGL